MPDYVREFKLNFLSTEKLDVEQVRKLYIETSQILLNSINSNEQVRPYLYKYPFGHKEIEYSISFYEARGRRVPEPYIAYVSLVNGIIQYDSWDHKKQDFVYRHSETYEEALKIVQAQPSE